MKGLIAAALRVRFIVVAVTLLLMLVGGQLIGDAPIDVFPEFAPPRVEIQTEVPGLSAAEVEALVTVPIENAVNGTADLKTVRSKTVMGLSSVVLYFKDGVDLMQARQLVQERLALAAARLPAVAEPPVILSPLSSTSRVMKIGMDSTMLTQVEMSSLARWTVRPRLMSLPGVANVAIWGQRDRELQIQVDPERLRSHGLKLDDVLTAARNAASLSGGSFIEGPNQRLSVRHLPAISSTQDLAEMVVTRRNGAVLTLGDVADIVEGTPPPIGDAIINDKPGILLIVEKQPTGNTLEVTRAVEAALKELQPALTGINVDPTIFRPATYIENSIDNLNRALLIGCLLVVLILTVFLYDWRSALISIVAIPLSLITAALVLIKTGNTINTMVLAGLIIALGEVVDDALIDVENIMRRLRLNRLAGNPLSSFKVVLEASYEVRSAVVFGSVIVLLALFPVFMLEGLSGTFFRPLALSYVVAIFASLLVALLVTPALSLILLPKSAEQRQQDSPAVQWLKQRYQGMLTTVMARSRVVLTSVAVLMLAAAALYPMLGRELLPNFREYDFLMHWLERPGTSLEAMDRITIRASKELRAVEGVRNFGSHVGRAEVADEVVGVDFTELWISLDPEVDYEKSLAKIQEVVNGYPGLFRDVLTYLRERIKEVLTGSSGSIVVRIFGPDLDILSSKADEVANAFKTIEGVDHLKVQQQNKVPHVEIRFKPEAAANLGLSPGELRKATAVLLTGATVGEIYEQQKVIEIVVRGEPRFATNIEELRRINVDLPGGGIAPLISVADVYVAPTPNQITREGSSRRIDVSLDAKGRSLDAVAEEVQAKLATIGFAAGYYPVMLGEYVELQQASQRLYLAGVVSLLLIFMILHAFFQSIRLSALIFLSLPAALVGGVFAASLSGGVISLGSLVGFVTVLGISARNGIMMISHFRHLEQEEGMNFGRELVMRGASERLAPILMTTLTTVLALMPLILTGVQPGYEIEHPMAVVIVGGLLSSVLLNLFVLPMLYERFGRQQGSLTE
jgi:CzcA family heavy metal efflux pump